MNSLVGDYSDSEEEGEEGQQSGDNLSVGILLPRPAPKVTSKPPSVAVAMPKITANDVVDDTVKRHDWELQEAPQKPKPRPGDKVRIMLPSFSQSVAKSDSDDSDDERRARRRRVQYDKSKIPASSIKLLSMLPAAKNVSASVGASSKTGGTIMMPYVLNRKTAAAKGGVKLSKKDAKRPNAEYLAAREKAKNEEGTSNDLPTDFFGINASHEVEPDESIGAAVSTTDYSAAYATAMSEAYTDTQMAAHPSQMYNYANVPDDQIPAQTDAGRSFTDDAARQLIIKRESQMNNGVGPSAASINIRDVNVDERLGPDVQANLMRSMTGKVHVPLKDPIPLGRDGKPDRLSKQRGQITYLAHLAKEREESIAESSSRSKLSRSQTRANNPRRSSSSLHMVSTRRQSNGVSANGHGVDPSSPAKRRKPNDHSTSATTTPWHEQKITSAVAHTHTRPIYSRLAHWGPLIALGVIGVITMSSIYVHLQWWPLSHDDLLSYVSLAVFMLWNYLAISNLFDAAIVGPGYVPKEWVPDDQDHEEMLQYCSICDGYKAPRSHHCRLCNRCVMKMDHHCPWINNCVGHHNHAMFIRFLVWSVIGCVHASYVLAVGIYYGLFRGWFMRFGTGAEPDIELTIYSLFSCVFGFGLAVGVVCAVGFLFIVQLKIVYKNRTNVEDYICAKADVREREEEFLYPYDVGWRENVKQVLWRSEVHKEHMRGFTWPIVEQADQFTFTVEQLAQKAAKREQARLYVITHAYNGAKLLSWDLWRRAGCCAVLRQPMIDGGRLTVAEGTRIAVTRASKYWLYGEVLDPAMFEAGDASHSKWLPAKGDVVRGWFPRAAGQRCEEELERMPESNSRENKKKK